MLQLLVPILVGCLLDSVQINQAHPLTKALHAHALQSLTRIGTRHPQVRSFYFRLIQIKFENFVHNLII